MHTEIVHTTAGITAITDEWLALEARDSRSTFYVTADFVRPWWEAFNSMRGVELKIVCVRHNGRLVGLAPLALHTEANHKKTVRRLSFAGRGDYFTFLVDDDIDPNTVIKDIFRVVVEDLSWDTLALSNIAGSSRLTAYLLRSEYNKYLSYHIECPYIDLRPYRSFDEFAGTSVPSNAHKYRRKLFSGAIRPTFSVYLNNEGGIFDEIAQLHRIERDYLVESLGRTERHSLYDDPRRSQHIATVFATTDRAVTFAYRADDGELLAYRTCYRDGRTLLSWNSAYHPRIAEYRVGKAIQYDIIQYLFRTRDAEIFDLGAGRYPWKFEWTSDFNITYKLRLKDGADEKSPATGGSQSRGGTSISGPAPVARSGDHMSVSGPRTRSRIGARSLDDAEPASATKATPLLRLRLRRWIPPRLRRPVGMATSVVAGLPKLPAAAALAARSALKPACGVHPVPRPTIWYVPHPDDETIFMGSSIYANRSAPNLIVLVTRGGKSKARERINAMLDAPLDESRFMAAREREFLAAVRELGISPRDVVVLDLPDGDVRSHEVRDIVRTMEQRQPGATHRTMSDVDPHSDHRAIGAAVRSAYVAGEISHCVFHLPFPLNSDVGLGLTVKLHPDMADAKRRALLQYTRWDPKNGWYAIGDQSVRSLIREQHRQPEERIHFPSGELTSQSYTRLVELVRRIRAKVRLLRDCDSLC